MKTNSQILLWKKVSSLRLVIFLFLFATLSLQKSFGQFMAWGDENQTWSASTLNSGRSDYFQGEVIPFVYKLTGLNANTNYNFSVVYDYYNSSGNSGGYAHITTYNTSRSPNLVVIGADPAIDNIFTGSGNLGAFYTVNADILSASAPTGTNIKTVNISFNTTAAGTAIIYWGMYIAKKGTVPPQGEGITEGAGQWPGGSLQIDVNGDGGGGNVGNNPSGGGVVEGIISGVKFSDQNKNGIKNNGESLLSGWKIFIDVPDNNGIYNGTWDVTEQFAITNASGQYSFNDLLPGSFRIREVDQNNWTRITPAIGYHSIALTASIPVHIDKDFGNFTCPSLIGSLNSSENSGTPNDNIICENAAVVFTATAGFANYEFKLGESIVQSNNSNIYTSSELINGASISVIITNSEGCTIALGPIVITVNPNVSSGVISGSSPVCIGAVIPAFTSSGTSGGVWSSTNGAVATINSDGEVSAISAGNTIIKYTVTGCNAPAAAEYALTVNPTTGATSFTSPVTTVCQDAANTTYTATAANSTSIVYSVLPVGAGSINSSTGEMNWAASFSGQATIKATANGSCGSTEESVVVTVNPTTGVTSFTSPVTTVCQDAANTTYTATAANSTSIVYSVLPIGAGSINSSTGEMNWAANFSGQATIKATANGSCGSTEESVVVTVNPTTGVTSFTSPVTTVCQDATNTTYTATAANSTSIVYSVLPVGAGSINSSTGEMNWAASFSGQATIKATANGLCGSTEVSVVVTVNPTTGAVSFTSPVTTVCQDAANTTYTATAANSTSIVYSVLPVGAGSINSSTGEMNWAASFSGQATIKATANGSCGSTEESVVVTVNPTTGVTSFTSPVTTVCQDAANTTYTATAANSTSIVYSVLPIGAGSINSSTGEMNWAANFSGQATIKATANGSCGSTEESVVVTVNPTTGATSFTSPVTTVCQDAANTTYTATAANSTSIVYSVLPVGAGSINSSTGEMNWAASFSGQATIKATANGLCGSTEVSVVVTVNPTTGAVSFTSPVTTVCQDAANTTYTATAANSTSIVYSVLPVGAGSINSSTGEMNWAANFSGQATIKATANGLCGTNYIERTVTVNPTFCVSYTGDLFKNTGNPAGGSATVNFVVVVTKSPLTSAATLNPGAFALFVDGSAAGITHSAPVTSADGTQITYSASYTVNLPYQNSLSRDMVVSWTFGNSCTVSGCSEASTIVTVSAPADDFVTGGGYIIPTDSYFKGRPGSVGSLDVNGAKNNFGFNVKWNRNFKNLQGNWNTILRRTEADGVHLYQVKAKPSTLVVTRISASSYRADMVFTSVNFKDLTTGLWSDGGGSSSVNVTVIDNGEPASGVDQIFISIKDKNGVLWYSSSTSTLPANIRANDATIKRLTRGNIQVHMGGSASARGESLPITSAEVLDDANIAATPPKMPELVAYPNPSTSDFRINVPVTTLNGTYELRITDQTGKTIETRRNIRAGEAIKLGRNYKTGIYIANLRQGSIVQQFKLIKL